MDIKTFLDNIYEHVCCPVCFNRFTNPKQLPCLHSFCLHCLQRIQATSGTPGTILCPECRRNFTIPGDGDLNTLPTTFRLNSLLDALPVTECKTSGVKCGNCDKRRQESAYCFTCCSFWCDDCLPLHNRIKTFKEHHALPLKDFGDEDFENIFKQPTFCVKHEKKELELFCQVCKTTICNSCAWTDHEGHAKITLEDAAKEQRLRLNRAIESKKRKVQKKVTRTAKLAEYCTKVQEDAKRIKSKMRINSAIESKKRKVQKKVTRTAKLAENCTQVQEHAERIKSKVMQFTDNLIAAIQAKKPKIFDEVEKKAKQCLKRLGDKSQEIGEEMKRDQTAIEKCDKMLKWSTNAQIMQPNEFLEQLFREESEQEDTVDLNGESVIDFDFEKNEELFNYVHAEQLGFWKRKTEPNKSTVEGKGISEGTVGLLAEIVVITRNIMGEQVYDRNNCVTMEIRNHDGQDCSTKPQIHDNKDGSYKISYFAKETGTCQASVKVNGRHLRGSPFKTEFKPRLFKPVLSFGKQGSAPGIFDLPWGIAVNDKDEIAVADSGNHRIQIFLGDGAHLRSFGRNGNQQGQFSCPRGITFYNNNIIVSDTYNNRIQIFDDQGHYLDQFGGKGNLNHQLDCPYGLSIDSDGNIIVADFINKSVKIFTLDGQFLRRIGEKDSFINPVHCIQHDNYFIVSDIGHHCIKVFDKQGKFLYNFGMKGTGDGEFKSPRFLSVDKAGQLLVCDSWNYRVQVFKPNGEFVTKFGASGTEKGKLDKPMSTAVLSDGRVIVTEFGNYRVQVFE
ncbi:PREDICTED: E3 ubiquitin-protein ligase TRIM71-like [Acropora digitifera]|uniref:E3 ubiquitin-protein ligase TRIM71-like n=1 Tax=Acropora digitifera TaxID=70779 RepID=UPI00077AF36A|nr:PREDICTED: E3 ubiquitin-protein ligase TRIM71-like [Acropora digitifera]